MKTVLLAASTVALIAGTASAMPGFGQLSYNGNPIAFTPGSGIGNDGFTYSESTIGGGGKLLVGLKATEYYYGGNGNMNPGDSTWSPDQPAGGSWLNVDGLGRYTGAAGESTYKPGGSSRARWNFDWSVTIDGVAPTAGIANMTMTITRPDMTVINVGTADITVWGYQDSWNVGFNFLSAFNGINDLGEWKISLAITDATGGGYLCGQDIFVTTPAPGALALLGIAGLAGSRRRRG
ncbi:MAG: hypothetical protein U0625_12290 [Phycisphaerales bacterium]